MSKKRRKKKNIPPIVFVIAVVGVFFLTLYALSASVDKGRQLDIDIAATTEEQKYAFIEHVKDAAKRNEHIYGVLSSVTIAQACLESNFGQSQLASQYYNLFGVKGNAQNGVLLPTMEYQHNKWVQIQDYFRVYADWSQSIMEHGQLLYYGTTWNADQYRKVVTAKTYREAANALVASVYATDPHYATKIIDII